MLLQTERLTLRRLEEGDFADFVEISCDETLCRMMGRDRITDEASARPTFDWLLHREPRCYAVVLRESGRMIGNLTVCEVPPELAALPATAGKRGCSLSFCIGAAHQRRGFMTEALRAAIALLFAEGFEYIHCGCFDFNEPSRQLQEKLGFSYLTTSLLDRETKLHAVEHILFP